MKDIHDTTFKSLMENKKFFTAFFKQYLPPAVFNKIDWETTRIFKISGEHIREVFPFDNDATVRVTKDLADLAYLVDMNVNGKKKPAMLSLHVEHQSTPDKLLPLRLALYLMGMLYEYAKANDTDALPEVYSLIYYHGRQSLYPYHKNIWDMFDAEYEGQTHLLNPVFVDLGVIADETLIQHREKAGAELAFKHIFSRNLSQYVDAIAQSLRLADDNTRLNVLRYVLNAGEAPSGMEVLRKLAQALPEEEKRIMTIAEQLRQEARVQALHEGIEQGMQQGMQQGKTQGEHEAKIVVAKNMLASGFNYDVIEKITGMSTKEIASLVH